MPLIGERRWMWVGHPPLSHGGERARVTHEGNTSGGMQVDTTAPLHQKTRHEMTVNLEPDVYAVAVSFAKAEDCSTSAAVNRLMRRGLPRRRGGRVATLDTGFALLHDDVATLLPSGDSVDARPDGWRYGVAASLHVPLSTRLEDTPPEVGTVGARHCNGHRGFDGMSGEPVHVGRDVGGDVDAADP